MKRILVLFGVFLMIGIFMLSRESRTAALLPLKAGSKTMSPTPFPSVILSKTLFVPYWSIGTAVLPTNYNTVAYFGITVNADGIDTQEDGYKNLGNFSGLIVSGQKKLLVVRLLDQNVDEKVLHDTSFQQKVIRQSVAVAKRYGFTGILVDLEYHALAFDEVVQGITHFVNRFAGTAHSQRITYFQTLYGDTLYRLRPFDAGAIGKVSDGVFILAYDFHKAAGTPGPNFPLNALSDENYSFTQMVDDFSQKISPQKLTIVFGMFGYDWQVDGRGQSLQEANSVTTAQAQQEFLPHCLLSRCIVSRDGTSSEMKATYTDTDNVLHEVWWEDMNSVSQKEQYLQKKGIHAVALWAWGYF